MSLIRYLNNRSTPFMLALVLGLAAVALGIAVGTTPAEQANLAARWTARTALPLFLVAYLATSLLRLWPSAITRALMRRRRQWGLGFALAHFIHLVALTINVLVFGPSRDPETLVGGGLAYVLIFLMAVTSNDSSVKRLGQNWRRLHSFGVHYIWLIFTISYAGRLFDPDKFVIGALFTPVMLAALALRLYASTRQLNRTAH